MKKSLRPLLFPATATAAILLSVIAVVSLVVAQGPPPLRHHTANESQDLELVSATQRLPAANNFDESERGRNREISANAIPDHRVGRFPNRGNPNEIREQDTDIVIPADPEPAAEITRLELGPFGIALNGVFFDPGAAEFWQGDRGSGWNYEALGGAVPLGLDENHAHVQPTGSYHYHGLPTLFLEQRNVNEDEHSPQIGWAADGFPIYALFGYEDPQDPNSDIVELESSYRLKDGDRPEPPDGPGGDYDGAFTADYEFVEGSGAGDLDECNGRFCVTPEYPGGTYAYFLTEDWPVIPRAFRGTPVSLRQMGPPPGGPGGDRGKGPPPEGKGKGGKGKGRPPFPPPPPPGPPPQPR